MADPHWSSYVGMATGVIGAITGIIGYRKANDIKTLDLRLELRKSTHDALFDINHLEELIYNANKSRTKIAAAKKSKGSSHFKNWNLAIAADKAELEKLANNAPNPDTTFESFSQRELESKLIEIHKFQSKINTLKNKYNNELLKDEEERKQLREDHRNSMSLKGTEP